MTSDGYLVLIGGGLQMLDDRPRPILALLARHPRSTEPVREVVLIPSASLEPRVAVEAYTRAFRSLGVGRIGVLDLRARGDAERLTASDHAALHRANVIFLTGGDQERLAEIVRGTPVHAALRDALTRGATVAGTSAGAVALAEVMHFARDLEDERGADAVDTAPGLGLVRSAFVDTHFAERQRLPRLFNLVRAHPERLGLGLDEDTAAVVHGRSLDVLGRGSLTIVDGWPLLADRRAGVHLHLLRSGDRYDRDARQPVFGALLQSDDSDGTAGRRVARSNS